MTIGNAEMAAALLTGADPEDKKDIETVFGALAEGALFSEDSDASNMDPDDDGVITFAPPWRSVPCF